MSRVIRLDRFPKKGTALPPATVFKLLKNFVALLVPLADYDLTPLLRPDNILINPGIKISLRKQTVGPVLFGKSHYYPGYTAPELYTGAACPQSSVYFTAALGHTLLYGHPPKTVRTTLAAPPSIQNLDTFCSILALGLNPNPALRTQNLVCFYEQLTNNEQLVFIENN